MRLTLALALALSLAAPARAQDTPPAPSKVTPHSALPAAMSAPQHARLTGVEVGPIGVETAATLQARLDDDNIAPLSSTSSAPILLARPLLPQQDDKIVGFPHAVLKTQGMFPAILAGSYPPKRYPSFPAKHRVPFPGSDGSLVVGLDLSDATLRLRSSPFERILAGQPRGTVSTIATREADTWGQNDAAALISTDSNRLVADPLWLAVRPGNVELRFRVSDGTEKRFTFRRPADTPTCRVVAMVDLDAAKVGAFVDGLYVAPSSRPDWAAGSGLRFAEPEFPDLRVGSDPTIGQAGVILGGLRIRAGLPTAGGKIDAAEGTRWTASDSATFGPSTSFFDASLDLGAPLDSADDPLVWFVKGAKRGCGLLTPAPVFVPGSAAPVGGWDVWDTVGEIEIKDIKIVCGDPEYGSGIEAGICRNLRVSNVTVEGGARGFDSHQKAVSYPMWIDNCRFVGQREVALDIGRGIYYLDAVNCGAGPRRAHIRIHSAGGKFSRLFLAETTQPVSIDVKNFMSSLAIADSTINFEAFAPDAFIRLRREKADGHKALLSLDHVELGGRAPKVAAIDLLDPYWKGRVDGTVPAAEVAIRGSLNVLDRKANVFRGLTPAWGAAMDGAKVTTDGPVVVPVPTPVPSPTGEAAGP